MNCKDILSKQISWCQSVKTPAASPISVYESFRAFTDNYTPLLKEAIEVHEREGHDSERYKEIKTSLPCFVYGGVCPTGRDPWDSNITPSHLMTIDIDQHDNEGIDINSYRGEILKLRGVVGVYHSLSGKGIWILLYIKYPDKFKEHYNYFKKLLKFKFGLTVDSKCGNLSRKRVLGYNPDWISFTNLGEIEEFDLLEKEDEVKHNRFDFNTPIIDITPCWYKKKLDKKNESERIHSAIETAIEKGYYAERGCHWYYAACDCKAFSDGYNLFYRLSKNHPVFHDSDNDIRKKYDKAVSSNIDDNLARKWFGILKKLR